jgi:hypothetical protein
MTILPSPYRITSVLKIETDIVISIAASPIERAVIQVILFVDTFKIDVVGFIGNVIMCRRHTE